jgi:putative addiction module component (TIGR02574 family)
LPAGERLRLAELLRSSVGDSPDTETLPLADAQLLELQRRLSEYPEDDDPGRPVDEVIAAIRARVWPGS